jgi:hypothetical protein
MRRRKIELLIVVTLQVMASLAQASAEPPMMAAETGVSRDELIAYAAAHGRRVLTEQFESARPGRHFEEKLQRLVEKAQDAWLKGDLENARVTFKSIAALEHEADWRSSDREAIHYAELRLAQSSPDDKERGQWLTQASVFGPDLTIEASLFPPPLVRAYQAERKRPENTVVLEPMRIFSQFSILYVDGRRIELTEDLHLKVGTGVHRFTAVSDIYGITTLKVTASQFPNLQEQEAAVGSGSCAEPRAGRALEGYPEIEVLFQGGCSRSLTSRGWLNDVRAPSTRLDLSTRASDDPSSSLPSRFLQPEDKSFFETKRTWLWTAVAAVAGGLAYVAVRQFNKPGATTTDAVHHSESPQ